MSSPIASTAPETKSNSAIIVTLSGARLVRSHDIEKAEIIVAR